MKSYEVPETSELYTIAQALSALESCGPGSSKRQLLCQIGYARGRLQAAIDELYPDRSVPYDTALPAD